MEERKTCKTCWLYLKFNCKGVSDLNSDSCSDWIPEVKEETINEIITRRRIANRSW